MISIPWNNSSDEEDTMLLLSLIDGLYNENTKFSPILIKTQVLSQYSSAGLNMRVAARMLKNENPE